MVSASIISFASDDKPARDGRLADDDYGRRCFRRGRDFAVILRDCVMMTDVAYGADALHFASGRYDGGY